MPATRTRRAPRSTSTSCWRSASAPRRRPDAVPATAVLAAAGSGERLGAGGPKALAEVGGRPMLAWSLEALARAESVGEVVIAAPHRSEAEVEAVAASLEVSVRVVAGGETRSHSVAHAVEAIGDDGVELVIVHDAARPLIGAADVDALAEALVARPDAQGVIAASPLTDTVKRAREPRTEKGEFAGGGPTVAKTESREHLWRAETPQVFRAEALRNAIADAGPQRLHAATDEAFLVEKAGGKVLMRETAGPNLKVTTPADLLFADHLLRTADDS